MVTGNRTRILAVLVVAIAAAAVRLLFLATYPFEIEGDGYEYYLLMREARPHLLFAPGYSAFMGQILWPATSRGIDPSLVLPWLQQAIAVLALLSLVWYLTEMIGARLAVVFGLLCGLDFFAVSSAGLSRPEFLQAALLCVTLAVLVRAATASNGPALGHAVLAGVLFGVSYLVKFNFITCLPLVLMLWRPRMRFGRVVKLGTAFASAAALVVAGFVVGIQHPKTGSWSLNLEHGWVHMAKLGAASIDIQPEAGIASRKFLVLSNRLPEANEVGCCVRDLWYSVDAVPRDLRAEFKEPWSRVLRSTDSLYVTSELARVSRTVKEIDRSPGRFLRMYFYLGLAETEELLQAVFFEAVRHSPRRYARHVFASIWSGLQLVPHYVSQVPIFEDGPFPADRVVKPCLTIQEGDPRFAGITGPHYPILPLQHPCLENLPKTDAKIWKPGAMALGWLGWPALVAYRLTWFIAAAHVALIVGVFWRARELSPSSTAALAAYATILGLIAFSAVVWQFRNKELTLLQPLLWLTPLLLIDDMRRFKSDRRLHDFFNNSAGA